MATSVRDVLSFHKIDRMLFDRVLGVGKQRDTARNIVALWMWLDLIGVDVVNYLKNCSNGTVFLQFVREAEAILHCLRQDARPPTDRQTALPRMASLITEPLDLRFFYCHRDVAVRGLSHILDGVGRLIFDDNLYFSLRAYEAEVRARGGRAAQQLALPPELERPYQPGRVPSSEDGRSMFITFSKGHPLSREDVTEYFTEKWGDCVERVMMERTPSGVMPMYGRVVFKSESLVELVLNREQLVKFFVKGRQLWARKYVPRGNYA